jgi:aspartate ammonia-lyase
VHASDRLIDGEFLEQFPSDMIQGGADTSTNMNANEVIANIALESMGYKKCAEIAREGFQQNKSIRQIVVEEMKLLTQEKWDEVFTLENLIKQTFIR